MISTTKKATICPLDCPDSCAMLATVKNGKLIGLEGDRAHPYTKGFICRKMRRYPERFYGKDRILYPQVRVGAKGAGVFRRVSWDEALDIVAAKLEETCAKYGGEAILPYSYAGNMGAVNRFAGYPLFHKLGATQLDQTICSAAAGAGWKYHCQGLPGSPPDNCSESDFVVAWGINIKVTNIHFWQYVTAARKRGARLLVIDPYRGHTAKTADDYISVNPGGDSCLALGLAKCIVEKELLQENFAQGCEGYDAWLEHLAGLEWESLVSQSGVSRADMERLAHLLATHPKTFFRIGIGLSRNSRGGMAVRAISALAAMLGLFEGGKGRGVLLTSGAFKGDNAKLGFPELSPRKTRVVNMIHLGHALNSLKPPVKALFVYSSNPLSVNPDGAQVRLGLERNDLFTVVHEQVMTPTARYADVLLPATTFLENQDVYTSYGHFYLGVAQPVVPAFAEARSNFDFFQELAGRMGYDDPAFKQTCEQRLISYVETLQGLPADFSIDRLLAGEYVLSSNSQSQVSRQKWQKKFSFVNEGELQIPALPCITAAGEFADPDLLSRFSLKLITPPHSDLLNSTFGERFPDHPGELMIHPDDAEKRKISNGTAVLVKNLRGSSLRVARITSDTRAGVVVAEGIFWVNPKSQKLPDSPGGINDLTSQKITDLGGGATFHESLVDVVLADPA